MSVTVLKPHQSETQTWERSAEANPASRGMLRAIDRLAEIRAGDGNPADAAREDVLAYPRREIPDTA